MHIEILELREVIPVTFSRHRIVPEVVLSDLDYGGGSLSLTTKRSGRSTYLLCCSGLASQQTPAVRCVRYELPRKPWQIRTSQQAVSIPLRPRVHCSSKKTLPLYGQVVT